MQNPFPAEAGSVVVPNVGKGSKLFGIKPGVTEGAKLFTSRKRHNTTSDSIERYVEILNLDSREVVGSQRLAKRKNTVTVTNDQEKCWY
jgi:hypothetical protein